MKPVRPVRGAPWGRLIAGTLLVLALALAWASATQAQPARRVLALHSYHTGYSWQQSLDQGLERALRQDGGSIQIFHEYMDTLRKPDPGLQVALFDYLRATYEQLKPDVIVASDNDALYFLLNYRDWLFGQVPVVFTGINDFRPEMLSGQWGFTGVLEAVDMGATLEALLRLRPQTRRLAIFGTHSSIFYSATALLKRTVREKNLPLELEIRSDLVFSQVLERVGKLPPEAALVVLSPILDDERGLMMPLEGVRQLAEISPVPLISFWDFLLGQGALGGRLVSAEEQGMAAGRLALRILAGEPVENIPVVEQGPNRDIFDQAQLERFGLDRRNLPPGAQVMNAPDPVLSRYRNLALGGMALTLGLAGVVAVLAVNIARRRRAEAALRASEELFSKAFRSSPAWVAISTLDEGRYLEVNDAFTTLSGYTREEALGRTSSELGLWLDPEDRVRALKRMEREGSLRGMEIAMRFKGDRVHQLLWSADTMEFAGKRCLVNVLWDISDMRRAQEERDQMEAQLRQAQKMEALGTLAGGIAHDFNNILGGILGFAELALQEAAPSGRQREHLEQVLAGCGRARDLVRQILTFGRRHETDRRPIRVAEVAGELVKLLRATLPASIEIAARLESSAVVLADPTELHLLLLNLCTNAAQAMERVGGRLELELSEARVDGERAAAHPGLAPGPCLAIRVTDSGPGIDPQTMARIFDPFFTTKGPRGTGLGLSVAHGIAQSLGGAIEVESAPGRGACFTVLLPRVQAVPAPEAAAVREIPQGHERVLLVDDEEALVEVSRQLFTGLGYRVESFSDSRAALDRFLAAPGDFDLVVTDLTMPGLSGRDLVQAAWLVRPGLPVLVLTGYSQSAELRDLMQKGPATVLAKPLSLRELAQAARQALSGGQG